VLRHAAAFLVLFMATAPTEISTLSLHDALPILLVSTLQDSPTMVPINCTLKLVSSAFTSGGFNRATLSHTAFFHEMVITRPQARSEEHTSELQSRENLVCRLLLEKKKKTEEPEQ